MDRSFTYVAYIAIAFILSGSIFGKTFKTNHEIPSTGLCFVENKGQIGDQFFKPRKDILFGGNDGHFSYFLKANGLSYQLHRVDKWREEPDISGNIITKSAEQTTAYRIDINWLNSNINPIIEKKHPQEGYNNYYNEVCPNGVTDVKSFSELIYNNVYPNINVKLYHKNNNLKYDFIVQPKGDYSQIKLQISGAQKLFVNTDGELIIETPLGNIVEDKPLVYQLQNKLNAKWVVEGNVLRFEIENINPSLPLIIDPGVRLWGSYYGGGGGESALSSCNDPMGNTYFGGTTYSNGGTGIATVGSHQSTFGGGADNAYIAKFNSAGVRQWGTYYGGNVREFGLNVACDINGNCALAGYSFGSPPNVISTPGSHQISYGGGFTDAFVVKFNTNGVRQWGTFYGGSGADQGLGVAFDASGNVFLTGKSDEATPGIIATTGVHQSTFGGVEDAFLVKFNPVGVRLWATYLGGTGTDEGKALFVDKNGDIYVAGSTDNSIPNVIATPGAYQNTNGGGSYDAYVVKFNTSGQRLWGTQYGGNGTDRGFGVVVDDSLNIFMSGKTASTNSISSVGCHQFSYGGGANDAFMVKFNSSGARKWGTYYGGSGDDDGWNCALHKSGHVYLAGSTTSSTGIVIATPGSHQPIFGGGTWDSFIVQFDWNGNRMWGTYYGGLGDDVSYGCSTDNYYNVFLNGSTDTNTGTSIATANGHQPAYGGGLGEAYIAKFYDCPAPPAPSNTTAVSNSTFCSGGSTTLSVISSGTISWYSTPTSTTVIGTGSTYATPALLTGTFTYYAEAASCTVSARSPITVTVFPLPTLNVVAFPTLVCAGKNSTLTVTGAATYTWDNAATTNSTVVTPSITTIYTVSGTSSLSCANSNTISITVYPLDPINFTPEKDTSCLHITGGTPILLTATPPGGVFSGPNVNGIYLNPTALGVFNPVYTYTNTTNGCVSSATASILVVNCTSLKEKNTFVKNISLYPNPTEGLISIETDSDIEKSITISDARGRIILSEKNKNKTLTYNIIDKAPGIYFIQINSALGSKEFKLVKE